MVPISEQKWLWGVEARLSAGFREETYTHIGRGLEVVKLKILQLLERAR